MDANIIFKFGHITPIKKNYFALEGNYLDSPKNSVKQFSTGQ